MYGMPMPEHLRAQPKDQQLNTLFNDLMRDNKLDAVDAKELIKSTADGGVMSVKEREDINRILDTLSLTITQDAVHILNDGLKSSEQGLGLKSTAIRDALVGMISGDFKIDVREAAQLINAGIDELDHGASILNKEQKADLARIVDQLRTTEAAKGVLQDAIDDDGRIDQPIIAPMYGIAMPTLSRQLKDAGLRKAFEGMLGDWQIDGKDADKLIKEAKDGGGLSQTERADLTLVLDEVAQFMTDDAKAKLRTFLGPAAPPFDPIDILPMYGMVPIDLDPIDPGPIDVSPIDIHPMYGMIPIDLDPITPIDTDPIIRPMYGLMPIGGINPSSTNVLAPRDVDGIRNNMPGSSGPSHYVILGAANSYPSPVTSITINGTTTPVADEGGNFMARGVDLSGANLTGSVTLEDGSKIPLNLSVQDVY